ncbi:MAG: hypothetical protein KBT06_01180 [Prevotellaceae bacterium]|nr:hypothetical protein [Candidatus Colivivens equi]
MKIVKYDEERRDYIVEIDRYTSHEILECLDYLEHLHKDLIDGVPEHGEVIYPCRTVSKIWELSKKLEKLTENHIIP